MSDKLTEHNDLRLALEGKTIRHVESTIYDCHGLSALKLSMDDGTVVYIDCREKNGGALLEVEKMY